MLGYSPRVYEGVRSFFNSHPVIEMHVRREADFASQPVAVPDLQCERCGFRARVTDEIREAVTKDLRVRGEEMPRGTLPADFFNAVEFTHAWDQQSRSVYCGGQLMPAVEVKSESPLSVG